MFVDKESNQNDRRIYIYVVSQQVNILKLLPKIYDKQKIYVKLLTTKCIYDIF
jgi:hypothetical protein